MSFLFGGSPQYNYGQVGGQAVNDMVMGLNNFNPWGYKRGLGVAGRQAKQTLNDYWSGNVAYDQMGINKAPLAALTANYAANNEKNNRELASGDAALADSGLLQARKAALLRQSTQDQGQDAANIVAGGYDRAANMYQEARNAQGQEALGAGGLALGGKQSALTGYINSFRSPTGYSTGFLDKLKQGGGGIASLFAGV